jgi:hypothetical protein
MTTRFRPLAALAAFAAALLTLGLISIATAGAKPVRIVGSAAAGRSDSGTAYFSINRDAGGFEYATGSFADKVLGQGVISYKLKLLPKGVTSVNVSSKKVVLYTGTGSLTGTATATIEIGATSETITNGKLTLKQGSGSQKGHSLVATFSGTGNLSTNVYVFKFKGTYK